MSILTLKISGEQMQQIANEFPNLSMDESINFILTNKLDKRKNTGPQRGQNVLFFRRKEDQTENIYELYEQGKRHLFEANLDCEEYEKAVKELAESLGI